MGEISLKCSVLSWGEYWGSNDANRFDFVTSWLLFLAASIRWCLPDAGWSSAYVRYFNLLRILRLLR